MSAKGFVAVAHLDAEAIHFFSILGPSKTLDGMKPEALIVSQFVSLSLKQNGER